MNRSTRNLRIRLSQGQLFWREVGQGLTIVFLHGSWQTGEQWTHVVSRLSPSYHCLIPDLLGFGESESPKNHYSIALEVECLAEYLKFLKVRRCVLVGHSLGGWVAATYALKYPHQVGGLVLLAPEGVASDALHGRWRWGRLLASPIPFVAWLVRSLLPLSRVVGHHSALEQWLRQRRVLRQAPVACQLLFNRRQIEIRTELLTDRLAELTCPVLLLRSEHDTAAAIALTEAYAQAPGAVIEYVPTTGSIEPWAINDWDVNRLDTGSLNGAIADSINSFIQQHYLNSP